METDKKEIMKLGNKQISAEEIEQIEMILDFEETNVELAHRQQYIKMLYTYYLEPHQPNTKEITEEEINNIAREISENVIKEMEMPTFIAGEEIEHIVDGLKKILSKLTPTVKEEEK